MRTIRDCYRELGKLYNKLNRGEVDAARAGRMAFILNSMVHINPDVRQEAFEEECEAEDETEEDAEEREQVTTDLQRLTNLAERIESRSAFKK